MKLLKFIILVPFLVLVLVATKIVEGIERLLVFLRLLKSSRDVDLTNFEEYDVIDEGLGTVTIIFKSNSKADLRMKHKDFKRCSTSPKTWYSFWLELPSVWKELR